MPAYNGEEGCLHRLIGWSYPRRIKTVRKLADTLQISCEELLLFLPAEYKFAEKFLSYASLAACVEFLDKSLAFRTFFYQQQQQSRSIVRRYLQQNIDVTDNAFAFVDLGGGGLTQSCLAEIMRIFMQIRYKHFSLKWIKFI